VDNIKQILVGKKAIFFDFDGVILDSLDVREWGFRYIFSDQDPKLVQKLIDFHKANGGISRFYKIRYFHEVLLGSKISKEEVNSFAELFSKNMIPKLNNPSRLIMDTIGFIKENFRNYNMYIVSGSEQEELRWLCEKLNLIKYFHSVVGSPTPKYELVKNIIQTHQYETNSCILIGDSINDYDAAVTNGIEFIGYNNLELVNLDAFYVDSFTTKSL